MTTNITTLEDPVEYRLAGINHQVQPEIGFTFATGLRAILRQDPNIILVGEIRDAETADIAVNAALTGHIVLTTLHTNDAAGAIPRLLDMGIEPFLLTSSVNAIVAQRLVRKLCPKCTTFRPLAGDHVAEVRAAVKSLHHNQRGLAGLERLRAKLARPVFSVGGCAAAAKPTKAEPVLQFCLIAKPKTLNLSHASSSPSPVALKQGMLTMREDGI